MREQTSQPAMMIVRLSTSKQNCGSLTSYWSNSSWKCQWGGL